VRGRLRPGAITRLSGRRRNGRLFGAFGADVWQTSRSLDKTPRFVVLVVMLLALGIGATTTVFSVMEAALIRPFRSRSLIDSCESACVARTIRRSARPRSRSSPPGNSRFRLIRESSEEKITRALNEAATQGYRFIAGDDGLLVVQRDADTGRSYTVIQARVAETLRKEIADAGKNGFRVLPNGLLKSSTQFTFVLEQLRGEAPRSYVGVQLSGDNDDKHARAMNEAGAKGMALRAVTGNRNQNLMMAIMEGGDPSKPAGQYRVFSARRTATLEKEMNEAGAQGFRTAACWWSLFLERPTGDVVPRSFRFVDTWQGTTATKELSALGAEGYRVACIPTRAPGEWEFLLERTTAAPEKYDYRLVRLDGDESFQRAMAWAEGDGFRLTDVIDRRGGLLERVIR
jgi:hypothetical protein